MLKKIIIIILLLVSISIYISSEAYAMDNVISGGDSFLAAANTTPVINEDALSKTSNYIYNILFTIAVVLAFAIGMIIGIQFILGSVEEQAKIKETLVPYVIGVFVVFASFTIWKIAINIGNDVAPTQQNSTDTSTERPETLDKCPYCNMTLLSGQIEDIQRKGETKCRNSACGKTITN